MRRFTLLLLALLVVPLLPSVNADPRAITCAGSDGWNDAVCVGDPLSEPCPFGLVCITARAPVLPGDDLARVLGLATASGSERTLACAGTDELNQAVCVTDPTEGCLLDVCPALAPPAAPPAPTSGTAPTWACAYNDELNRGVCITDPVPT